MARGRKAVAVAVAEAGAGPEKALSDLEARYAKALATIEQLSLNQAQLSAQLGMASKHYAATGQLVVGIRNVSNYSVGMVDKTTGQAIEFNLNPERSGVADPRTRAVVSYVFWQQLRQGNLVGRGLIVRDDSVLGPADNAAPLDRESDLHPEHLRNLVLSPRDWIVSKSEEELREAVAVMTSEPTLRRLMYAVDQEIVRIGEARYKDDPERARKSIRDLPALFRVLEELAEERLDELNPVSKVRHLELGASTRQARHS
jgi:hypothetical protein